MIGGGEGIRWELLDKDVSFKAAVERCLRHQQINDALLVRLAEVHDASLITFDRRWSPPASFPRNGRVAGGR